MKLFKRVKKRDRELLINILRKFSQEGVITMTSEPDRDGCCTSTVGHAHFICIEQFDGLIKNIMRKFKHK